MDSTALALLILGVAALGEGRRVSEKIYVRLSYNSQCFRVFNATHQIGCQSDRNGNAGSVAKVETTQDVLDLKDDPEGHGPFIAVVNLQHLAQVKGLDDLLIREPKVSGVLVIFDKATQRKRDLPPFSADDVCPNADLTGYPGCAKGKSWNSAGHGDGMFLKDWPKPLFLINNQTEIDIINKTCLYGVNRKGAKVDYPRCGARLKFWMFGAVDTPTCLRRNALFDGIDTGSKSWKTCAPMSDRNVFGLFPTSNASVPSEAYVNGSVLVLAAKMDSFSMVTDQTPGLQSALAGVTVLLAVAEALGREETTKESLIAQARKNKKSLLFAFFNGESLDFIGSGKFLWDLVNYRFPLAPDSPEDRSPDEQRPNTMGPEHLGFVLEAGQTALPTADQFYAHVSAPIYALHKAMMDRVVEDLRGGGKAEVTEWKEGVFPPASYSSFTHRLPTLPGILFADFKDEFNNKYYNSFLDTGDRLDMDAAGEALVKASESFLGAALGWIGADKKAATIDAAFVKNLFGCFGQREHWSNCSILNNAAAYWLTPASKAVGDRTYITPIGGGYSTIRMVVNGSLNYFLGDRSATPYAECHNDDDRINMYVWMRDPKGPTDGPPMCVKAPVYIRTAQSPAFDMHDYDSRNYSTFSESTWGLPSLEATKFIQITPQN